VPFDVQLAMVRGMKTYIPDGYEAYARFFFTKPEMRFVYGLIYITLTLVRLKKYYTVINQTSDTVRKPKKWVWFLIVLMLTSLINSIFASLFPREVAYKSFIAIFTSGTILCQHIVLTYYTIRRQFLLYVVVNEPNNPSVNIPEGEPTEKRRITKTVSGSSLPLTIHTLEAYIKKEKPHLNRDFKMTDLEKVFGTNRTYISNFINETYHVNFNRYINRLRLKEIERLLKLPSNKGKIPSQLIHKAGFTDIRHYNRALDTEKEGVNL